MKRTQYGWAIVICDEADIIVDSILVVAPDFKSAAKLASEHARKLGCLVKRVERIGEIVIESRGG